MVGTQRDVARFSAPDLLRSSSAYSAGASSPGFAVVTVKYRMRPESHRRAAYLLNGTAIQAPRLYQCFNVQTVAVAQQNIEQLRHILTGGGFIERSTPRC